MNWLKYLPQKTSIVRRKIPTPELTQISLQKKPPLLEEKIPTPQHLVKLVNNNKTLNLNIASYFLNVLASPDESTWSTKGGPINKTIENLGLSRHHQKTIERKWHMINKCKKIKKEYTGNNYNLTRHFNPSYLVSNVDEINLLANSMENILVITYTTKILNCHRQQNGVDAVCSSTVNLSSLRLVPKITRILKIQHGTKNEGKWKESGQRQTK